jgi:hypothetical protein
MPDDFLTEVIEFIDNTSFGYGVRAIVAFDYMSMIASAMEQEVRKSVSESMRRIMQSGIITEDKTIFTA